MGSIIVGRMRALVLAPLLVILAACSKVTPENFAKIQDGMAEDQVLEILGKPGESSSVNVLGVSGTSSRWVGGDTPITVTFVNGKVALKTLDKPAAPEK